MPNESDSSLKSNFFVSLLFSSYAYKKLDEQIIKKFKFYKFIPKQFQPNNVFVYFDDVIYSGN